MHDYIVYVKPNDADYITAVNSSAFLDDPTGWVEIDRGAGDRYHHAQNNYFDRPIITESGVYRYKLVDGKPVECTSEEIAAQIAALPKPTPVPTNQENADAITELQLALAEVYETMLGGV